MSSRLLITGCSGFIGKHMVAKAISLGYEVRAFDRVDCSVPGAEFIKGDVRDMEAIDEAVKGVDYVIHLAAITVPQRFRDDLYGNYDINIKGFMNIIESARKHNCKLAYASSASMYFKDNFAEDATIDMHKQRNHYSKSKMVDEMIADSYEDVYGFKSLGLRYFNAYGEGELDKGESACAIGQFIKSRLNNEPMVIYGDGKQKKDFIYVNDAVDITLTLMEKGATGIYNVGTGKETEFNYIADLIDKNAKKYIPMPLPTYQYLTRADTTKLLKTIGDYKFISIEDGINKTLKYYGVGSKSK